jgi:SAM-dependent methyltransferase
MPAAVIDPQWRPGLTVPAGLARRYGLEHFQAVEPAAQARLQPGPEPADPSGPLAWDLLYWNEPELYDRLTEGEPLHPDLLASLPLEGATVVDVGAGTGRLTLLCAARAARVYAVEPAAPMRRLLEEKIRGRRLDNVDVAAGFSDALPLPDASVDLVVSASAFGSDPRRGGEAGLHELRRVVRPGGRIAILWPDDPPWFIARGFRYQVCEGALEVRFRDLDTAFACAEIFYSDAVVSHLQHTRRPIVPFDLLGINPPRDACWLDVITP